MSYGHASGEVRIYEYGVPRTALHHGLGEGQGEAVAEMRRRLNLWNRLVEIDQEIEAKKQIILAPYPKPEKGRRILPPEVKVALQALEESYREPVNKACRESGCYSCNYTEVKIAWQAARKRPGDVKFHRWDGSGRLVVFLIHGLPVAKAWGDQTQLQLRNGNRPGDVILKFRAHSDENHKPVWLTLPIRMHRPLPEDALIKSVAITRQGVGPDWRWHVFFCLERPNGWRTHETLGKGKVAVDLGWRRVPTGLRVAVWRDETEQTGELVLSEHFLWAMGKVRDLESIRDNLWNETIAALRAWLKTHERLPQWLADLTSQLHLWKRKGRLERLYRFWSEHRFKGDQVGFAIVETWNKRDHHLWEWEAHLRDQTLADRREKYRIFADWLTKRYDEIVLEDFDLRKVAELDKGGGEMWQAARRQRQWASVHQLRLCIESTAKREKVGVTKLKPAYSTVVCAECGSLERWDKAKEIRHTCLACGATWDQDQNAATNLLKGESAYSLVPEAIYSGVG